MRSINVKTSLANATLAASILLATGWVQAATVSLTAAPTTTALPDGQVVDMWGYFCGATTDATCTALDGLPQSGGWQPPLITVTSGSSLTINLTNNLSFTTSGPTKYIPTSLVIVGQLGGGLGDSPLRVPSPTHAPQGTTWPGTPGTPTPSSCTDGTFADTGTFCPPAQADRVRSFGTEVAAAGATLEAMQVASGSALTWPNLRAGTYLIETGTHPSIQGPMGLYGVLVVTGSAYPVVPDASVPLLLSEIDPIQNTEVAQVVHHPMFDPEVVWSGQHVPTPACGDTTLDSTAHWCYPPAVNYDPLYFLVNGQSFDRTDSAASAASVGSAATSGSVLLRFVNAGLRMHVPSVVGASMSLLAEDGNILPGVPKVQNELFLAAGKTYDVTIEPQRTSPTGPYADATYAVYDRALGLSTNNQHDGGMQAYINVGGGAAPADTSATANDDEYSVVSTNKLVVSEPSKGLLGNDIGIYGAAAMGTVPGLTLYANGTFEYLGPPTTFTYCGNGATSGPACAMVTLNACAAGCLGSAPTAAPDLYSSNVATQLKIAPPGVLENDTDPSGFPLRVDVGSISLVSPGLTLDVQEDGSFVASAASPGSYSFDYAAMNSQNTSSGTTTATIVFPTASGLTVNVLDAASGDAIEDYRWIIQEDRTILIDPTQETNCDPATDATCEPVRNVALNFHASDMTYVAQGCVGTVSCEEGQTVLDPATGMHEDAICDIGNGVCRAVSGGYKTEIEPGQVALDPAKRYYISVLPGDAADEPGHTMGGAAIGAGQSDVDVFVRETPLNPAKISIFVFQDDWPLNGEHDGGGGVDVLAPNEAGLGGFNIVLLDQAGARSDSAGQITYDEFNEPVTNALAGREDPSTGYDACHLSDGVLVGQIVTCPKYEYDSGAGWTDVLSPLAGHAVVDNMYAGFYEVVATPSADRIARGEEWLQTNTLDGTKAIEVFIKPDEPAYFQEFGPGGFHVAVGFANAAIINARKEAICNTQECNATIHGTVTALHISRTPDQRVYSSGTYDAYAFGQCYVSLGTPGITPDFELAKCDENGEFTFENVPAGDYRVTVFDQWNDLLVDGLVTPIRASADFADPSIPGNGCGAASSEGHFDCNFEIAVTEWRLNLYGRIFLDTGNCSSTDPDTLEVEVGVANDGVSQACEPGLPLTPYNIRYRDGSYEGFNNTDLNGYAGFNEIFPFINWLVVDIDNARFKHTGTHVVYDAGGAVDTTGYAAYFANTNESPTAHVPDDLRVPGARYCQSADCAATDPGFDPDPLAAEAGSTGRVDPPWVTNEAWTALLGQNNYISFAMKPFAPGENGGIRGLVNYASTRPFDDPALLVQLSWAPGVPNVKVNLYEEGVGPDGTKTLHLVDTTETASWDAWAQGFRSNGTPNMSCAGQETTSPFYYTLYNSTYALDPTTPLPYNSQFKCYDGWAMLNQIQPATYNGAYSFPSMTAIDPETGEWLDSNCHMATTEEPWGCVANPSNGTDPSDPNYDAFRAGKPMLEPGNYVVEIVPPSGYEIVKEEDKNILLGDIYNAPAEAQIAGFGNIFIMPDQAAVRASYNPYYGALQATTNNGALPRREGDTGSYEVFWPCVGASRVVPDLISLFPGAEQATPFAGATRNLCDRKAVTLSDDMTALVKFYVFTSAHVAGSFTGTITNDFAAEFDPFSPSFGEKAAVANLPVAMRDFAGKEIWRGYSDQWGQYNGVNYSSYTVNPPSPSGYIPQMMIACMNDPGPIQIGTDSATGDPIMGTDPNYNPAYSNFCYEIPIMPGQTQYLDTPVVPTMAFADKYNLPDCEYPDTTPAIGSVVNTGAETIGNGNNTVTIPAGSGPWVSASGSSHHLTINALGEQPVINHAYSGPNASTAPYNEKFITRRYDFGDRCEVGDIGTVGCDVVSSVTIGGVDANIVTWTPDQIVVAVPTIPSAQSSCPIAQRNTVPGSLGGTARCGELVVTRGNGKQSIDTVTVTVGGKAPTLVSPTTTINPIFGRIEPSPLQTAIDNAAPGDLLLVQPGTYREMLLMWKPVRIQGVGAASVVIDADAHPAGKLDAWRKQVVCLFGLTLEGRPTTQEYAGCPLSMFARVDRLPLEGIIGWDASANGNLAGQIQEPTLMGAYEGAGITVLGKGVSVPNGTTPDERFGIGTEGAYPDGYAYLGTGGSDCTVRNPSSQQNLIRDARDYGTSNFLCNPSRIDGVTVTNSSQGGGGIFAHGWNHNLEVANTRVYANHGTFTGGITIGNSEFPTGFIIDGDVPPPPGLPIDGVAGQQNGYGFNRNVNVHHNRVTSNLSIGDALYSKSPSAAGGVSFCNGAEYYKFSYNWVCGNLSTGDAGGVAHAGFTNNGTIEHNWILFNQSQSATVPTNGGGLAVIATQPDRLLANGDECGTTTDVDCPPGLPAGTGRNLKINANLILGNSAESGTGGGLRLQMVNGEDVVAFPTNPARWNDVAITNNIFANNVSGWDGAGVSMQDALRVRFVNNTVIANDTTASAGVLFNTLGAPFAATPPPGCEPTTDPTEPQNPNCIQPVDYSRNQVSGLVTMANTPNLDAAITGMTVTCPTGYGYSSPLTNGQCRDVSLPLLTNNLFWENRAFHIGVGALGADQQNQQAVVTLYPTLDQGAVTGFCPTMGTADPAYDPDANNGSDAPVYWDIGVRGDTAPNNHGSGFTLAPRYSILSPTGGDYAGGAGNIIGGASSVVQQYCNGSRIPPEIPGGTFAAFRVPPGRSETTGLYPIFALTQLTPSVTSDEGNNWINLRYGPLSLSNATQYTAAGIALASLGDYSITDGSDAFENATSAGAPADDFFGNMRPGTGSSCIDIGAVELQDVSGDSCVTVPSTLYFSTVGSSTVPGVGGTADDSDIYYWSGSAFSRTIDMTTLGVPASASVDGYSRVDDTHFYVSFSNSSVTIAIPGPDLTVQDEDIVYYNGTTWQVFFDGSFFYDIDAVSIVNGTRYTSLENGFFTPGAVVYKDGDALLDVGTAGVSGSGVDIDGLQVVDDSHMYMSFGGDVNVAGIGAVQDEDVVYYDNGTWSLYFDGTASGLTSGNLDIDALAIDAGAPPPPPPPAGSTVSLTPTALSIVTSGGGGFTPQTGTGTVTLTNTGSSSVTVSNVSINGSGFLWSFSAGGTDTCTGANLTPGQMCSVQVSLSYYFGTPSGTLTFTDTATGSPHVVPLSRGN